MQNVAEITPSLDSVIHIPDLVARMGQKNGSRPWDEEWLPQIPFE